jgi:putative spermidine/putrescine transport system permease protein
MTESSQKVSVPLAIYGLAVIIFLLLPIVIAAAVAFNAGERAVFPPEGFSFRWFYSVAKSDLLMDGLYKSLIIAVASTTIATVCGTCAAVALNHYRFVGRAIVQAVIMMPIALPAIVLGLGILFATPLYGLSIGLLVATLGHAVLGIPYVAAMVLASLGSFDRSLERASLNLGVGPIKTFFFVTLPHIKMGVIAGAVASFLLSLDNISLSLFVTRNDTMPLRLMQHMLSYTDPSVAAMSVMLLLASFVLLLMLLPIATQKRP